MFISRQKAVFTAALCLVTGLLPSNAKADISFIIDETHLADTLHTHLYSFPRLPSRSEIKLAACECTACDGGLKCPFGEAWYCPSGGQDMTELCSLMGYAQTCTGSNQTRGTGQTCGGLYKDCSCTSGYKWDNGACINPCSYPYIWNGSSCICSSSYEFSCSGSYQKPVGASCNGKYTRCSCSNNKSFCMNSNGQFDCLTENSLNCYAD